MQSTVTGNTVRVRNTPPWERARFLPWDVSVKYVETDEEWKSPLSSVVISGNNVEFKEVAEISTVYVSDASPVFKEATSGIATYPRWRYDMTTSVTIGEIVERLKNFLSGLGAADENFTKPEFLEKPFRYSSQLFEATSVTVESSVFQNKDGGVDIFARVQSASGEGYRYVVISVTRGEGDRAVVRGACTCPVGHLFCKHQLAVILANAPMVFGAIEAIEKGKNLRTTIKQYEKAYRELLRWASDHRALTGVAYYLGRYLSKTGRYVPHRPHYPDEVEKAVTTAVTEAVPPYGRELRVVSKRPTVRVAGKGKEMLYEGAVEEAWKVVKEIVIDLSKRLGYATPVRTGNPATAPDWVLLLTYGILTSSEYSEPPVVIGAVGDPGTGKTAGFIRASEYVKIPFARLIYTAPSGTDQKTALTAAYRNVLETLRKHGFISSGDFEKEIGGLIHYAGTSGNTLTVVINLAIALTYPFPDLKDENVRRSALAKVLSELAMSGFSIEFTEEHLPPAIIDKGKLSLFDALSVRTEIDTTLGYIKRSPYLGTFSVLFDEGTRNPQGLDNVLTITSVSDYRKTANLFGITSNIGPFNDMVSDPNSEAIQDRLMVASMPTRVDRVMRAENINKAPSTTLSAIEAAAIWRVIKSIPVTDLAKLLIMTVRYGLTYRIVPVNAGDTVFLYPLRRSREAFSIEAIDLFSWRKPFGFVGGLRFDDHAEKLAKFFAFINKHGKTEVEDVIRALSIVTQSRIQYTAASTNEFRAFVAWILRRVRETANRIVVDAEKVTPLLKHLKEGRYAEAEKLFNTLVDEAGADPVLAIMILTALRIFHQEAESLNIDELPKPIALTLIGLLVDEGNVTEVSAAAAFTTFEELTASIGKEEEEEV